MVCGGKAIGTECSTWLYCRQFFIIVLEMMQQLQPAIAEKYIENNLKTSMKGEKNE
jgi:hypothetical protein